MSSLAPRPTQWRGSAAEAERIAREFPALAGALARPESRRQVLRLMAASMALGGLGGCDPSTPDGHYTPSVNQSPDIIPGLPNRYATAFEDGGAAAGIVVTHQMGRPVKVEGNPAHPASLGGTSIHGQALILDFYDPDRQTGVLNTGDITTWQSLLWACAAQRDQLAATKGRGLRLLTGRVLSPTLAGAIGTLLARYPEARWDQWEPVSDAAASAGLQLAYERPAALLPHVDKADVVLALDSDLISGAPGYLRYARDFAARRNPTRGAMSRVYAAEPVPSSIGMAADHRFIADPAQLHGIVRGLAAGILESGAPGDAPPWLPAVLADLQAAGPRALIHAGPSVPAELQALVHHCNEKLGGRGSTFDLIAPVAFTPEAGEGGIQTLLSEMQSGQVSTLVMLETNPAYSCPGFKQALAHVPFSLCAAASPNETARIATWHVPQTHVFEAWGDLRAHDGTVAIQQPQALPLYGGHNPLEVLALFTDGAPVSDLQAVRQTWRTNLDDPAWQDVLANGVVPGTASAPLAWRLQPPPIAVEAVSRPDLTLLIRPDPNLIDGRHANNAWLQELPRPTGKIVWDNPLLIAPATASKLGLATGDEVILQAGHAKVQAPVWIEPGQAPGTILGWLGGGRTEAGEVGNGVGTDLTPFLGNAAEPSIHRTGSSIRIASTDHHNVLDVDRKTIDSVVRHATLAAFTAKSTLLQDEPANEPSFYPEPKPQGTAWGMSVDLNACIGCNACVIACQAENNVPVVGREQVLIGREMHWLRIDRYYEGPAESPDAYLQPMLCMHCEEAPCEPVCPVEASIHDSEGLNLQVYNRCIGTRFCSNNCPYKVRRFNYGAWAAEEHRPPISRNADVTVRSRGVMEKCTFCVQRIAEARIAHDRDGVPEQVVTACQAACPTQVFSFGNINDPGSDVSKRKASPLTYALLPEQNTRPRLTYEGRILNRNPAIPA